MIYALKGRSPANDNDGYCRMTAIAAMRYFIERLHAFYGCEKIDKLTNSEFLAIQIATFEITLKELEDGKI